MIGTNIHGAVGESWETRAALIRRQLITTGIDRQGATAGLCGWATGQQSHGLCRPAVVCQRPESRIQGVSCRPDEVAHGEQGQVRDSGAIADDVVPAYRLHLAADVVVASARARIVRDDSVIERQSGGIGSQGTHIDNASACTLARIAVDCAV